MRQTPSIAKSASYVNEQNFKSAGTTNRQAFVFCFPVFFMILETSYHSLSTTSTDLSCHLANL